MDSTPMTPAAGPLPGRHATVWAGWIGLAGILVSAAAGGVELLAEGGSGTKSGIAFGSGLITYAMIITAQAAQITLTLPADMPMLHGMAFDLGRLCAVTTALANIPAAVMFTAVAVLSLSRGAFPTWLGWIAAVCAVTSLLSGFAAVSSEGALAPTGWLTSTARVVPILFYVPAALLLISRRRRTG